MCHDFFALLKKLEKKLCLVRERTSEAVKRGGSTRDRTRREISEIGFEETYRIYQR